MSVGTFGSVLEDGEGRSLYLFTDDPGVGAQAPVPMIVSGNGLL